MGRAYTRDNWFTADKDYAIGRPLPAPYDKIFIGCDPLDGMTNETAKSYDAIVNVSCSECAYFSPAFAGQKMHWTPVNEMGQWSLAAFYYVKKVLDYHYERGDKVYLHCHAGAYRSPTMAIMWLVSRGHSYEEAKSMEFRNKKYIEELKAKHYADGDNAWQSSLRYPFYNNNIPKNLGELYYRMNHKETFDYSFAGMILGGDVVNYTNEVMGSFHMKFGHWKRKAFPWWYQFTSWKYHKTRHFQWYICGKKWNTSGAVTNIEDNPKNIFFKVLSKLDPKWRKRWNNFVGG